MADEPPRKKIVIDLDFFGVPEAAAPPGRVHFLPADTWVELEPGESIFDGAKRAGIVIPTVCGGKGTCGQCRVQFPLPARPATILERQFIDRADLARGVRLACRSRVDGEITVTVLPEPRFRRRT